MSDNKIVKYTAKQKRTVENYFNPRNKATFGNLVESAIQAGYSKSYANSIVRNQDWIIELKEQMQRFDPEHIYRGFQELALNADKDADRIRALELMGKSQGMFVDRSINEHHVTFVNDIPRPDSEIIEAERVDNAD